ncbi:odorant receptor 82a-like [Trichogramma pretiosum]|uniref:odorant receptor 82a-like n=1 Tax=Trichogramma pretiosum TaxID=7493 RepID=UPI000C71B403|nr:odorant receptor 82a-like [Trichogramma pretiosum]
MDLHNYFKYNEVLMSLCSQWPYQSVVKAKIIRGFFILQHISICIPEFIRFIELRNDLDNVVTCIIPIIYNIGVFIKFLNAVRNMNKIKNIIETIKCDYTEIIDNVEVQILHKYASFGKFLTLGYISMCALTLILYLALPLSPVIVDKLNPLEKPRPKSLIYMVQFYVDQEKYFYVLLLHSYITTAAGVLPILATDTFYASIAQHACGMLAILGHRLEKARYSELNHVEKSVNQYKGTILTWGQLHNMIRYGMFTAAQMFHLLFYCYQGHSVLDKSLTINDSINKSNWYGSSIRTRKLLTMMIMRSQKPLKLTAKLFPLTLPHFTSVLRTSMSYFTLLKSVQ